MDSSASTIVELDPELAPGCFPYGFWKELAAQFKLAWPLSLSMLFHYLIQPISIAFCGHLGKVELASVAMAISVIYVVVVSIGRGLAFGGDTFFAQTYGSQNKKNVGVYLQKGIIFALLWSMPVVGVLLNTENLLLLIGQNSEVARLAQVYVTLFSPGVLAYCCLFMVMRYLLCQNRVIPILLICMVSCGMNALLNYGLIYQADMGIKGSAIALAITYYLVLILMLSYIWGTGIYRETWPGWSFECLENWGEFFRVTSYSISMTFIFWLCTEVGTFLGGVLSPKDLSAFSISFQIEGFAWMLPLGIGGACTARLGQFLGANKPRGAANAARVALTVVVVVSAIMASLCYACRFLIPRAFTTDRSIIDYTASVLRLTALFLLFEGFGGTGVGIVRATGKQAMGTLIVLVAYYVIAWPIGIPLMFATDLGLFGLWWGLDAGIMAEDVFLAVFVFTMNWDKEAEKAVARSQVGLQKDQVSSGEADETTRLLQNPTVTDSINESGQHVPVAVDFQQRTPAYKRNIVFKRLLVLVLFAIPLSVGIVTRFYVHVKPDWSVLCIPTTTAETTFPTPTKSSSFSSTGGSDSLFTTGNNVTGSMENFTSLPPVVENTTLPFCHYEEENLLQYPIYHFWI